MPLRVSRALGSCRQVAVNTSDRVDLDASRGPEPAPQAHKGDSHWLLNPRIHRPSGLYRRRSRAPSKKPPPHSMLCYQCLCYVTIFAKTQRLPLLPLHQDADSTHAHVDEQHAYGGVQEEVDEVPGRRGHSSTVRKRGPPVGRLQA